jgi:hypothetical protein
MDPLISGREQLRTWVGSYFEMMTIEISVGRTYDAVLPLRILLLKLTDKAGYLSFFGTFSFEGKTKN